MALSRLCLGAELLSACDCNVCSAVHHWSLDHDADQAAQMITFCEAKQVVLHAAQAETAVLCSSWTYQEVKDHLVGIAQLFDEVCTAGDRPF